MYEKNYVSVLILMFVLLIINLFFMLFLLFFQEGLTGRAIENYDSWTKAICDSNNYCHDYEIKCNGDEIISLNPTGNTIQFSEDWKDPRDKEIKNKFC